MIFLSTQLYTSIDSTCQCDAARTFCSEQKRGTRWIPLFTATERGYHLASLIDVIYPQMANLTSFNWNITNGGTLVGDGQG